MSAVTLLDTLVQESQVKTDIRTYREREEAGDAELFASMFRDRVIYDHAAKAWYVWRGNYWERDRTGELIQMVISRLAAEYMQAGTDALKETGDKDQAKAYISRAKRLMTRRRIDNVLHLAGTMEGLGLAGDEWDTNPLLLGVNNGVIDLATGIHRTGLPSEFMQVHTPVDWLGINHPAPSWERFMLGVFDGDQELVSFMQRLLGYCLTGATSEHVLPILWGEGGRNGKTTMLETLAAVFGGDLAHTTQADALMDLKKDGASPQPFVYALRGRRLVWATESREGQRINGGLVKQLTGGDSITTRTLFRDITTFKPSHKVMLLTNHKPHMSAEDQALWDRVLLIPFELRFVDRPKAPNERQRIPNLTESLQREAAGILAWLVKGCLAWQEQGLCPPEKVRAATEAYREEEDTLGEFISDCLIVGEGKQATARDLYSVYEKWAKENGIDRPLTKIALGKRLARRYGQPKQGMRERVYSGIGILAE